MPVDQNAPADTTIVRIVHDALRRDLRRARAALTHDPAIGDRQRKAVATHVRWMMEFLEAHHRSEDAGVFAVVRERVPEARSILDEMAADHERVAAAIAGVERASVACVDHDERESLVVALDALTDLLVPHLRREEDEVLPIVAQTLTNAEWSALEQEHNLDGKSLAQLGHEGHWLMDDASPEDRSHVKSLVPPVPRFVLVHGFGPIYRRRARACWTPSRTIPHHSAVSVEVDAPIEAVWDVVRDPTRVGEWSHECVAAEWIDGAAEARPRARFRGRNEQGFSRWGRVCEIVSAEPHELVWRTVPTRLYPDSSEWAIRLDPCERGTRIEQTYRVLKATSLEPLYAVLIPGHRDRSEALRRDLERIGDIARVGADRAQPTRV